MYSSAMDSNMTNTGAAPRDSNQVPIITAWAIMTVLAGVTVAMRFYTRRLILRILGPEDWLILGSMVLAIGACVGFIRQTMFGLGRHVWTLSPEMVMEWQKEQFISFVFYGMSLALAKISIVFLYKRIMVCGPQRIANYALLGVVVACNVWVFISNFIQCIPLEAIWNPAVQGTCTSLSVNIGNSVLHIVTDFAIFILPIPSLIKLKIDKKQKIGLMVVFSLGFFVCLISISRLVTINQLTFDDRPYQCSTVAYWGAVEVNLAIICACLTTLKPLIVRLFPEFLGSMSSRFDITAHNGAAAPETVGTQRVKPRQIAIEEREFSRLDEESVKSEQGLVAYEMDFGGEGRLEKPGRSYGN